MKRSAINRYIAEAAAFFAKNYFSLPPFASWTPEAWRYLGDEATELRTQRLGWDVTDFNSGIFETYGLILFTLRNGHSSRPETAKPYTEKIMHVRNHQLTPFHYHAKKTEDIINRGNTDTGRLVVQIYGSTFSHRSSSLRRCSRDRNLRRHLAEDRIQEPRSPSAPESPSPSRPISIMHSMPSTAMHSSAKSPPPMTTTPTTTSTNQPPDILRSKKTNPQFASSALNIEPDL